MTAYKEINVPASAILQMAANNVIKLKQYDAYGDKGKPTGIQIFTSEDNGVQHLSVFHLERPPSFREVMEAKNRFFPNIEMAIYFPRGENVLSNVHHLWEVESEGVDR